MMTSLEWYTVAPPVSATVMSSLGWVAHGGSPRSSIHQSFALSPASHGQLGLRRLRKTMWSLTVCREQALPLRNGINLCHRIKLQ